MSETKSKTVSGLMWNGIETFLSYFIQFIIGIILARLIAPDEFGLVGMIAIFIAVSNTFIEGGFIKALVRKSNITIVDYSTAFYYNLIVGGLLYFILFISSKTISDFFDEPQLNLMIKILGLSLVIGSFTIVQSAILIRRINFKLNAKIRISSIIISGILAIFLAYKGFGVWSLVFRQLIDRLSTGIFLWLWNKFIPSLVFSISSFRELFGFGSKLLLSGMIDSIFKNVYFLIIGKYFSAADLGFYTRAKIFRDMPSITLTQIISTVTFPVLSQMQEDKVQLKSHYKRIVKSTMFISFTLLIGMAAISEPLIISLIGEVWRPSIIYLQLLCIVGMIYPISALNLNILNVFGRSDLFLKLEIIKKIFVIPVVIVGIIWGIKAMIYGMMVESIISFLLNSSYSGRFINYKVREQIFDILPSFLLAIFMGIVIVLVGELISFSEFTKLILLILLGSIFVFGISEWLKIDAYLFLKKTFLDKVKSIYNARK